MARRQWSVDTLFDDGHSERACVLPGSQEYLRGLLGKGTRTGLRLEVGELVTTATWSPTVDTDGPRHGSEPSGPVAHGSELRKRAPAHPELFEPSGVHRTTTVRRLRLATQDWHPLATVCAVVAVSFVLLTGVFVGVGALLTHVAAHSQLGHDDEHVSTWFAAHRTATWNGVALNLTKVADVSGIVVISVAATLLLLARRWGKYATFLVIGLVLELAVFETSEHLVGRPRPQVRHLGVTPPTYSWPSGHTAATVVLYGGIALLVMAATNRTVLRATAWLVATLLSVGVAWARVYEGEHHLSDVIGGALLGVGCVLAAVLVLRAWTASSRGRHVPDTIERDRSDTRAELVTT